MTHYQEQLTWLLENSEVNESIRSLRLDAFELFKKLGFPTKKDEDWRFTNFSKIQNGYFRLSRPSDLPNNFESPKLLNDNSYPIVIINGHYQPQLSKIPNGISVFSGSDDFKSNPHSYAIDSNKAYSSKMKNPFYLLNTSLMNSGLCFEIHENIQIEKPIEIFFCTSEIDDTIMNHPRFHFRLNKNSKATIIEHYSGQTKQSYFINTVSNFELEENAHLTHFRFQDESFQSNHTSFSGYSLNKYSNLNCNCLSIGSELYRHNIKVDFTGSNGFARVNGLSLIDSNRHHDLNVIVNHLDNSCTSSQLFKFILSDSSTGVFNGKVIVDKDTFQTNANQTNRNLLLSSSSNMNSNPQLEIHAEDVKCSHGSTTGQIDPEALFYLRSRGISKQRAIELVVEGFAKEVFTNIKDDNIQSRVNQKIGQWLESVSNHDKN
ncbi:MAG: Fe-S cluster assembly protein SufD [bacterium TMED144]|nr:MAG: Fe-S cluster assembly protein SufD [bacterium TMED144]|tara:strand:+ start:2560 stop:3858 length:1299 start_codon:yes stop_codon:yes gene_type:complete